MIIKVGDKIQTSFCTGIVKSVIDGSLVPGWRSQFYFEITVTVPKLPRGKSRQIIRMDEVKSKLC